MRVLLTGSSGHLGSEIARLLPDVELTGIDLRPGRFTSAVGTLSDRAWVFRQVEGVDAIVHTASLHAPDVGRASEAEFWAVNVEGTRHLLDAAHRFQVTKLIYTSTTSVYGNALVPKGRAVWVTEELVVSPRDIYDRTKLAAEELCLAAPLLSTVVLRTGRFFDEPLPIRAVHRLHRGADVRDVATAHRLALFAAVRGEILIISGKSPFHPEDAVDLQREAPAVIRRRASWVEPWFAARGWALPTTIDRVYAIDKAERLLGYHPQYGVADVG